MDQNEKKSSPRWEAYRALGLVLEGHSSHEHFRSAVTGGDSRLSSADAGLFTELFHGILREWDFLNFIMTKEKIKIRRRGSLVLWALSVYQILFLDRIPRYAVFAELKSMGKGLKLAPQEMKYLFWAISHVERLRTDLLSLRSELLEKFMNGKPAAEFPYQTMASDYRKWFRGEGFRTLAFLRRPSLLLGYQINGKDLPKSENSQGAEKFLSPRTKCFQVDEASQFFKHLKEGGISVQGDASIFLCDKIADAILSQSSRAGRPKLLICELHAGKGGKFFSTIHSLLQKGWKGSPALEWWAIDSSPAQIEVFEQQLNRLRLIVPDLKQIKLETRVWNWSHEKSSASEALPEGMPALFDMTLVDAPCSGLGTVAKNPEILMRVQAKTVEDSAKRQALFVARASSLLHQGGELFYSVCTFTEDETTGVVQQALKQNALTLRSQTMVLPQNAAMDSDFPVGIERTTSPEAFFFAQFSAT